MTSGGKVAPSSVNDCEVTVNGDVTWEGHEVNCTFPNDVTFTSYIDPNAQSRADHKYAG